MSTTIRRVNTDVAYEHLRDEILDGRLAPGEALMTEDWAARIGVSRTPVRDALRRLEADGLVTIIPRLGAHVTRIDEREFIELCEVRLALEAYAAGMAAENRTSLELSAIRSSLLKLEQLTAQLLEDPRLTDVREQLVRADVSFHLAVIEASRNSLIRREVERLNLIRQVVEGRTDSVDAMIDSEAERQKDVQHLLQVQSSHTAVFAAIEARDPGKARSAMEAHIQDVISRKGIRFIIESGKNPAHPRWHA